MIIIHNVMIEIDDRDFTFNNPVVILKNFRHEVILGEAFLTVKEDGIYADLHLFNQLPDQILWPAIGYNLSEKRILTIGLCTNPNVDPRINCVPNS